MIRLPARTTRADPLFPTRRSSDRHGGGRAEKSYLHARDLGRASHLIAEAGPTGRVFNAGPPAATSIREVVERCAGALGVPFDELCEVTGDRLGQDSRYWPDSPAIREPFGWEQPIGWDEGLAEVVGWSDRYIAPPRTEEGRGGKKGVS